MQKIGAEMRMMMRRYFKGYYFKCCEDGKTVALIPALHSDGTESSASLQIITNDSAYVIPYDRIHFCKDGFGIKIGNNYFSEKGVYLDAESEDCRIRGKLKFGEFRKIKYDIMGPFRYFPWMECRHSVVSMNHPVTGKLKINDKNYSFKQGRGYIEGDRGCSFPRAYIWTQCHFENGSVMLSVADIPFCGFHFNGIIGIVMTEDREYRIATYLGAKLVSVTDDTVIVKQGKYRLSATLTEKKEQKLKAPVNGSMQRMIHESAACKAEYSFICGQTTLLQFTGKDAGFEFEMERPGI